MLNIISKLKKYATTKYELDRLKKIDEKAKRLIEIKLTKQELLDLIDPSQASFDTSLKRIEVENKE